MNPILDKKQTTPNLITFMNSTSPDAAKKQVMSMLEAKQIDRTQFERYKKQATDIANMLGVK